MASDTSSVGHTYEEMFTDFLENTMKSHKKYGDSRNHYASFFRTKGGNCEILGLFFE
jgi:hypothetical protein